MSDRPPINTSSRDWAVSNAWRMRNYRGPKATVPGGHEVEASAYVDIRAPGSDDTGILSDPQTFLRHPKPGHTYVWRGRTDDNTVRLVELHMLRPVLWEELREDLGTVSLFSFQQSGIPDENGERKVRAYIAWKKLALFEVDPQRSYEWFKQAEDYHMHLVTSVPAEAQEALSQYGDAKLTVGDNRSAAQEAVLDRSRRG